MAASSGDYSMEVLEAFSDGKNLTFSMDVTTTSELWNRYDWVGVGSNLNGETTTLAVNGTPVETSFSDTLERGEDNHYTGAVSFALPEAVEDGTELNVEFSVTQLTFPDKFTYEGYVYVDVDWNSAFTVTADASGNKSFAVDASDAGVEILNVDAWTARYWPVPPSPSPGPRMPPLRCSPLTAPPLGQNSWCSVTMTMRRARTPETR